MKTVLVVTSSYDCTADYIMSIYHRKCKFFRFDVDRLGNYNVQVNESGWTIDNFRTYVDTATVDAIYYRRPDFPEFADYNPIYMDMMKKDIVALIKGMVNSFGRRCLTKPYLVELTENKIYQLAVAEKVGFLLPKGLVTNNRIFASEFCGNTKSVVKPLSNAKVKTPEYIGMIHTKPVNMKLPFEGMEISPVYFQHYIRRDYDVRAVFIKNKYYASKIELEDKTSLRKEDEVVNYENIEMPKEVKEKCLIFMEKLGLNFAIFDFMVDNEGDYYFMEMNPNGQWLWLEYELNWKIGEDIVKYLIEEE